MENFRVRNMSNNNPNKKKNRGEEDLEMIEEEYSKGSKKSKGAKRKIDNKKKNKELIKKGSF